MISDPSADKSGNRVVELDERTWLPRHVRGDERAFSELLNAYRAPVYSYLVRCGVDAGVRDDLFQDVFLKIHSAAATYQPARPLRPWIYTILANTVRSHLRGGKDGRTVPSSDCPLEPADPRPGTDEQVENREIVDWVETAIAALPPAQREVLLLISVEGFRHQEVAEILHAPVNTVKTHLRRARLNLAKALLNRQNDTRGAGDEHDRL